MNRLKLKCYSACAGLHLIMLLVLVVGPGFLASRMEDTYKQDMPVLTFVPDLTTDKPFSGGGNPNATPPPPAPVQPTPAPKLPDPPQPEPVKPEPVKPEPVKPEPVKPAPEPVKVKPPEPTPAPEVKPEPKRPPSQEPDVVSVKPQRKLPTVNTNLSERRNVAATNRADKARAAARAEAREREQEELAAHERSREFASAVSGLRHGLSSRTEVGTYGPGGGGPTYANFKQTVMTVYLNAWTPPAGLDAEKAVTKTSVTIARNGRVVAARITVPSGNAAMDASVRRVLDRVKFVAPLPPDSKESERSVPVVFDLTAKRDLG
jgi:colicin import membrane protein